MFTLPFSDLTARAQALILDMLLRPPTVRKSALFGLLSTGCSSYGVRPERRCVDVPQSDPPTPRRRQTYGPKLAPEDHKALSSISNPILRPNTAAASARVSLSESYEILPFGPSCSLERFPSDASDDRRTSSHPLNSSPPCPTLQLGPRVFPLLNIAESSHSWMVITPVKLWTGIRK